MMSDSWETLKRFKGQSWSTILKTGIVRLPRAVPIQALHILIPEGPQPFRLQLPSRDRGRTIPLYVFVPPVRFPNPKAVNAALDPHVFPIVTDYHGGGFYLGSCLEQAPFCAKLCRELQAIVISVDYRMAPVDRFPAAIEDAEDVTLALLNPVSHGYGELRRGITDFLRRRWYETLGTDHDRNHGYIAMPPQPDIQLDVSRLAFSGASSGGNIALNVALSVPASMGLPAWPSPIPPDYQHQIPLLLLYPSLDLRQLPSERFRPERLGRAPEHKRLHIDDHLASTYVSREMASHPRASPGLVDTAVGLHKKAKILLILSGIDTLWEQSNAWVDRIEREGRSNDLKTMRYNDRKHGWTTIPVIALSSEERRTRLEVLDECVHFTKASWQREDPVKALTREFGDTVKPQMRKDDAPEDQAMAALLEMGFDSQSAHVALAENEDVESAILWLLQHDEKAADHSNESSGRDGNESGQ